ncbi:putative bromodomain and WD repeat-containing protein 3-like [Apostichopus japonicus]|uniref:Putative bromodomain and WD repeat-containing protein 3-like n=1 Tax=Stichopus japonicus TaxID=307972 RepID=A0A2G8KS99_STIJA|nr:putative bromodomain and WD repeat-containing protein 3-like [Apostichopus japonicus]
MGDGSRKRGRPRARWMDGFKQATGLTLDRLRGATRSRKDWRIKVMVITRGRTRLDGTRTAHMGKLQKKEELRKTPCSKKLVQPLDRINSSKKSLTKERLVTLEGTGDVKVWVKGCNQLIEVMEKLLEDSTPLRQQSVNPGHRKTIKNSMHLQTVKTKLNTGSYRVPTEFRDDVRLVFKNFKQMHKNKDSEIYGKIQRLSRLFEDNFTGILQNLETEVNHNTPRRYERDVDVDGANQMVDKAKNGSKTKRSSGSQPIKKHSLDDDDDSVSCRKKNSVKRRRYSPTEEPSFSCKLDSSITESPAKKGRSSRTHDVKAWIGVCTRLLDIIFDMEDSVPFRQPKGYSIDSDKREVIKHPMDLQTVKDNLSTGIYRDPIEFAKDIRLIFNNSKAVNTKKKSEIYEQTVNLSKLFEENIIDIIQTYKNAMNQNASKTKDESKQLPPPRKSNTDVTCISDAIHEQDKPGTSGTSRIPSRSSPKRGLGQTSSMRVFPRRSSQSSQYSAFSNDSSDNSDGTDESPSLLQSLKRKTRKTKKKRQTKEAQKKGTERGQIPIQTPRRKKICKMIPRKLFPDGQSKSELREVCKPSSWITDTIARKSPYVPQIGDEVMYFWQGHKAYVEAVKEQNLYSIDRLRVPWKHLKLEKVNRRGFQIRYHDMPNVVDFLVLAQHYDIARRRQWKPGDTFRVVVRDRWWLGVIESKKPFEKEHPNSLFRCYAARWDTGEADRMSPWDLEPVDKKSSSKPIGAGNSVKPAELKELLYKPQVGEWDECEQGEECDRILKCLDQVMSLRIAEMFKAPVDLSTHPDYAMTVPYPMDLTTIRNRLRCRFYRRRSALRWEVRRIEWNANAYCKPNSQYSKKAKQITNILLEVISDPTCYDAVSLYNAMVGTDTKVDVDESEDSYESENKCSAELDDNSGSFNMLTTNSGRSTRTYDDKAWVDDCRVILSNMFVNPDSTPFRQPVDESELPHYRKVIGQPMDLSTVREQLDAGFYQDPLEFTKDVRLMINNSKAFNTNKKSQIYSKTATLSAFFEDSIRETLQNYKSAAIHKASTTGKWQLSQQRLLNSEQRTESDTSTTEPKKRPGPSGIVSRKGKSNSKEVLDDGSSPSRVACDSSDWRYWESSNDHESSGGSASCDTSRGDSVTSDPPWSPSDRDDDDEEVGTGKEIPTSKNITNQRQQKKEYRRIQHKGSKWNDWRQARMGTDDDEPHNSPTVSKRNSGQRTKNDSEDDTSDSASKRIRNSGKGKGLSKESDSEDDASDSPSKRMRNSGKKKSLSKESDSEDDASDSPV